MVVERDRERKRETEKKRERERKRERKREKERETDRQTHRHTEKRERGVVTQILRNIRILKSLGLIRVLSVSHELGF